jgi:hypothetical protein
MRRALKSKRLIHQVIHFFTSKCKKIVVNCRSIILILVIWFSKDFKNDWNCKIEKWSWSILSWKGTRMSGILFFLNMILLLFVSPPPPLKWDTNVSIISSRSCDGLDEKKNHVIKAALNMFYQFYESRREESITHIYTYFHHESR